MSKGDRKTTVLIALDGRDTPPRSAGASLEEVQALFTELGCGRVASICGRYYAMVGHTGILAAAVQAVEALDECLGRVEEALLAMTGLQQPPEMSGANLARIPS